MNKLLITGFSGFVARYFLEYLSEQQIPLEVLGIDIAEPPYDYAHCYDGLTVNFTGIDLLNIEALRQVFARFVPDYLLHLASFSSVAYSWKHPVESFANNTNIFLNIVTVVKEFNPNCRILSVGSSEEYGNVTRQDIPLKERQPVRPISPYAVARVSQELLSKVYVDSFDMNIVLTRSFNHIGPRQDERFVIPSFIKRMLEIHDKQAPVGVIETGNLDIVRDFTDVRDVVRAYYLLLTKGRKGEVYNVCSGRGIALHEIVTMIAQELQIAVETKVNPDFVRPNDNMIMIGENFKIKDELGWKPEIPLETSIRDMVDEMRRSSL
jgi:GDP-4-dehydro-6-deoxy-D-mannose reductase